MNERVRGPGRGKRSVPQIQETSSSDSDSDVSVEVTTKRKKNKVITSESSDDSSGSSVVRERTMKPRRKMLRVWSDNESSSEDSSDDDGSDGRNGSDSTSEDDDDVHRPCGRVRQRLESEDDSCSSNSDSGGESSESGHSSANSCESCNDTEEEAMVQAAIQESLAIVGQPSQSKMENEDSPRNKSQTVVEGFASDSSDGQSEKCPICLVSFSAQEIGSPETCDHSFCSVCIQEWAKNVNTCPVDRQPFTLILVRKHVNGKVIKKIPVQNREARDSQESDSDPTFCEVCGRSDREDRLLLCDGCDLGYHLECLDPPMENVPVEEWFCPDCASDQNLRLAEEVEMQEGELLDLLEDVIRIHPRRSRLLPRTRQSERVRATIRSLHQEMQHQDNDEPALQQPSTSGIESVGADSGSVTSGRRRVTTPSVSTARKRKIVRRKTVRKRRKRRTAKTTKRKTVKRKTKVYKKSNAIKGSETEESEENEEYIPKAKRRKRRKRKICRRKKKISRRKTARTAVPRSVKGRLANQLGLCAPTRPGMSLPVVRSRAIASDIDLQRSRAGIPALHIYGPQNELEYFSSENEISEGGNVSVAARPHSFHAGTSRLLAKKKMLSAAALQSHTAVTSPKPIRSKTKLEGTDVASSSPVDLIGSILDSQTIWHSKTPSVTIKPDGTLEVNKDRGGTAVSNTQGTVVCDSVSDKNKNDNGLIRSDNRLSEMNGSSSSLIDLGSVSARTTQTPMYPGRGDSNRPPPNSGFHQFGGNRYSAPNYSNYQGGRDFSNFSSSASNFDASSSRAGYSNYLNSGLPPPLLRNTPVRFRVTPRYPIRRPHGPQRPQDSSKQEDKKIDEGNDGNQRHREEEDDDDDDDEEIDIYSDIEAGGGGSGGPSAGGSEQDETERSMETSYEALPPPPEPSALLMGFGEQLLSEEEPTSDSELVIDDNGPSSPQEQNEGPQIPESEKYDPAEPLADSDDDEPPVPPPVDDFSDDEIPLPPSPPILLPFPSSSNIINTTSNSNASYLHSPTYGDASFETDKVPSVADNGVVSKVVKEVIQERLRSSPAIIKIGTSSGSPAHLTSVNEDDTEECPNFSIYSAASMDIARRTGQGENNAKGDETELCKLSENETREGTYKKDIVNEKYKANDSDKEFDSESPVENKSSAMSKKDDWDSSDENSEEDMKIKNSRHGTKVEKEEEGNVRNGVDQAMEMKGKVCDSKKQDDIKGEGVEEKVDNTGEADNTNKVEDAERVENSDQVDDAELIEDSEREDVDQESESDREDDADKGYSKENNIKKGNEAERVDNVAESDDSEKEDEAKRKQHSEKEEDEVSKYDLKEGMIMKKKVIKVEGDPNCEGNMDEENDEFKVNETVSEDNENSIHKIIENKDKSEEESESYDDKVSEQHDNKQSKNEMVKQNEGENENNARVDNDKISNLVDASNSFDNGAGSPTVINKSDSDGYDNSGEKRVHVNEYPDNLSDKSSMKEESNILNEEDNNETLSNPNEESNLCYSNDHRKTRIDDTFDSDDDSLIGGISSAILVPGANPPAPSGLEGLDTETISETEEAINFEDISQDGNGLSVDEDGEISSGKKKKKKRSKKNTDSKTSRDVGRDPNNTRECTPPEEGEIIDDRPKVHDSSKRERTSVEEKVNTDIDLEVAKIVDANFEVSKPKDDEKKKKKKEKRKSIEKSVDKPVFRSSSENRRRGSKEKSRRSEEKNISWKKPSKSTKERNYRESKSGKPEESSKDKDDESKDTISKKKKKEKRKDMERYDVRKIVSDKRRRRKDEFGRDLSRDRTLSRSRSRSHRRSRERSRSPSPKNRRLRSPARARRSRSRSRFRSRSRSHRRSRSKSKNRARRKSKDRSRRSRSKERTRARVSRSRSRGRRSRSRSRSHSRSKNKTRMRSRSRTPIKQRERKDRNERSHLTREAPRFHTRRSWSRTWTPSWSRSHSRSLSCSSFTQSRSPSVHHFNRSFSRSFSRSWSRERYERIPLEKTGALSSKVPKKLTVIVSNTKDSQKKEKKKKKEKKSKETLGNLEKRKKRKEKSPAPSKEVFTSGDNILVSVNFNKSKTTNKDVASSLPLLPKETNKRKRDDTFEVERDVGKKIRKEKNKDKNKTVTNDKVAPSPQGEKKGKKQLARGNKNARMAAILKQKPVAIIDLDQSPFREQTPSPRDLIVLSDSDDEERNKTGEHEAIVEALSVCRGMRPDSNSPQSPAKGVSANIVGTRSPETELKLISAVSNYLNASTGPKTPPEPQIKFSIATKQPQLRSINNPLQEEDDILQEDAGLDDSDQRIEEELDRSLGDIVHKGPNTPPEPRGPTTPCSPPTSPDAYDPFDPTKSGTPSPAGPEASMDGPPSPPHTPADELQLENVGGSAGRDSPLHSDVEDMLTKNADSRNKSPPMQSTEEAGEDPCGSPDRAKPITRETKSPVGISDSISITPQLQNEELPQLSEITEVSKGTHGLPTASIAISEGSVKSPERKIGVVITTQPKLQSTPIKTPLFPIPTLKQVPTSQQSMTSTPSHGAPPPLFPSLTPVNIAMLCTPPANLGLGRTNLFSQPAPLSVPALLQHVTNAANAGQARLPSDKPPVSTGPIRLVQNGEPLAKPQDTTTEVVDMDLDSPYSPGSSEGDDLFDPPADTPSRSNQPAHPAERSKMGQTAGKGPSKLAAPTVNLSSHKSPNKTQDKFDTLFGLPGIPTKATGKSTRSKGHKGTKSKAKHAKGGRKEIAIKMDEDQLQILDELPSSAVELQVKDKFLKKLNRQERVVEEVKLSLKPHYNRKHITKEEYKDILRKSVPKICHNKSGEINPVKIATLVEAYVKKVRYEKKKSASSSSATNSAPAKGKVAKTTKWS